MSGRPVSIGRTTAGRRWPSCVRLLQRPECRLLFAGQSVSLIGTWMTRIAVSWLVFRETHSALLLGIVGFTGQVPTFFLGPIAGALVDRWDRRRILLITQVLSMLQAFALLALALSDAITVSHIVCLSILRGVINAFDTPAREAFVIDVVQDREGVGDATALNSAIINVARLIGPSLAGVAIVSAGESACFLIDGLSYLAGIFALTQLRAVIRRSPAGDLRQEMAAGWRYVSQPSTMRSVLGLLAVVSLVGVPYTVVMPIVAGSILHGGPHALGLLISASGLGALAGALCLNGHESLERLTRRLLWTSLSFGTGLIFLSESRWFGSSLALMFFTGFSLMQHLGVSSVILKTTVAESKRGCVMSYYNTCFLGMTAFGTLLFGICAGSLGVPRMLFSSGLVCILGGLLFTWRHVEWMRPVYLLRISSAYDSKTFPGRQ